MIEGKLKDSKWLKILSDDNHWFSNILLCLGFILLSLLLYYPSRHYGMVTDFINWLYKYDQGNASDILHCFGYPGLHQFFHLINYSIYQTIGTNTIAWFAVLTTMHGLNTYALFIVVKKIINSPFLSINNKQFLPLVIALVFLVFPYNVEAVVWRACLHYLIVVQLFLIGVWLLWDHFIKPTCSRIYLIHLVLLLALFTLELSFVFPLLYATMTIFFYGFVDKNRSHLKDSMYKIILPQFLILGAYILSTKLALGQFIGHYGAEKHIILDFGIILPNALDYFFKNLFYAHFWTYGHKELLYTKILTSSICYIGLGVFASFLVGFVIQKRSQVASNIKLAVLGLGLFFIALLPIITLYFYWQHSFENDRYAYFANMFFIFAIVLLIAQVNHKALRNTLYAMYLLVNIWLFMKMMVIVNGAAEVQHHLLSHFNFEFDQEEIFILAIPDNFKGAYLFRDHKDNAHIFKKSLGLMYDKKYDKDFTDIAQFNQSSIDDGIKVDFIDDNTIHVGFNQIGNWFWRSGIGLSNYENDIYKVEKKPGYYKLIIKEKNDNQIFLYPDKNIWKSLRWPKEK